MNITCNDRTTIDVTSNHLDVYTGVQGDIGNEGDEPSKRSEDFGMPVGKSVSSLIFLVVFFSHKGLQMTQAFHPSCYVKLGKVKN